MRLWPSEKTLLPEQSAMVFALTIVLAICTRLPSPFDWIPTKFRVNVLFLSSTL